MIEIERPKIECVELTEDYGKFVVEPLERGFGTTLGKTDLSYSIVYCLFGVWFIVYLPVSLYTKSKRQVEKSEVFIFFPRP